ncbi:hypothetical protein J1N35_021660 [Gossypium stocksii]|uniref:Uncharacterized protein n=1 Tax=Gossypium stocksii TaxID=47602 RepID=A0A9D3VGB3_9ROSI|nr:hypothetical protein J1N35_021660 [Gossypium stocksii]
MDNKPQLAQEIKLRTHSFLKEFDELGKRLPAKFSPTTEKWSPPTTLMLKTSETITTKKTFRNSSHSPLRRIEDDLEAIRRKEPSFIRDGILSTLNGGKRIGIQVKIKLSLYISGVRSLAKSFLRAIFRHASRDCSRLAHEIAQVGFKMDKSTYWVEKVPSVAAEAVTTDRWWVDPPD